MVKRYKASTVSREAELRVSGSNYKKVAHHMEVINKGIYILEGEVLGKGAVVLGYDEGGKEVHFIGGGYVIGKEGRLKGVGRDLEEVVKEVGTEGVEDIRENGERVERHFKEEDEGVLGEDSYLEEQKEFEVKQSVVQFRAVLKAIDFVLTSQLPKSIQIQLSNELMIKFKNLKTKINTPLPT
jgi:hypothetical protein